MLQAECKSPMHEKFISPSQARLPCPSINCCPPDRFFLPSFLRLHRNARKHLSSSSDSLLAIVINMSFPRNSRSRRSSGPPQAPTTGGYYGSSVPLDRSEVSPSAQETLVFHCYPCGKRFQVSIDRTVRTAKSGERVELRCPGCDAIVGWSTEDAIQDNISEMRIMVGRAVAPPNGAHQLTSP